MFFGCIKVGGLISHNLMLYCTDIARTFFRLRSLAFVFVRRRNRLAILASIFALLSLHTAFKIDLTVPRLLRP